MRSRTVRTVGERYPYVVRSWRTAWSRTVPYFVFSAPIRKGALHDKCDRESEQCNNPAGGEVAGAFHEPAGGAQAGHLYLLERNNSKHSSYLCKSYTRINQDLSEWQ